MESKTQTSKDSNVKALYCKRVRGFYGVIEIKLLQEDFWLVLLKLVIDADLL